MIRCGAFRQEISGFMKHMTGMCSQELLSIDSLVISDSNDLAAVSLKVHETWGVPQPHAFVFALAEKPDCRDLGDCRMDVVSQYSAVLQKDSESDEWLVTSLQRSGMDRREHESRVIVTAMLKEGSAENFDWNAESGEPMPWLRFFEQGCTQCYVHCLGGHSADCHAKTRKEMIEFAGTFERLRHRLVRIVDVNVSPCLQTASVNLVRTAEYKFTNDADFTFGFPTSGAVRITETVTLTKAEGGRWKACRSDLTGEYVGDELPAKIDALC